MSRSVLITMVALLAATAEHAAQTTLDCTLEIVGRWSACCITESWGDTSCTHDNPEWIRSTNCILRPSMGFMSTTWGRQNAAPRADYRSRWTDKRGNGPTAGLCGAPIRGRLGDRGRFQAGVGQNSSGV